MNLPEIFEEDELDEINLILYGIPRRIYERKDYFHSFDDWTFLKGFGNNSVAPINQLLIFLRFCATGSHLACVADFIGVHESTVSRLVVRVSKVLASFCQRFIQMPSTPDEISESQLGFYQLARFPRVIGTLDGTHVKILSPGGVDPEVFRNRKNIFSINVQVIASYNLKLLNLVARWPGSTHDSTIFNNSTVRRNFEDNLYPNALLLGDSAYYSKTYLLTPLQEPTTRAEELYNKSHIRTRNSVERMIGVWKRRFPVLAYGCRLKLDTILMVIVATGVLYNICKQYNEEEPPDVDDIEQFLNVMVEDDVPNVPVYNVPGYDQDQTRRNLINNYFESIEE